VDCTIINQNQRKELVHYVLIYKHFILHICILCKGPIIFAMSVPRILYNKQHQLGFYAGVIMGAVWWPVVNSKMGFYYLAGT